MHPGTSVGPGCEVQDGVVLGKPPKLARHSRARGAPVEPLVIEDGAVICCGAIVFAGAVLAAGAIVGDQAYVRERAVSGRLGDRARQRGGQRRPRGRARARADRRLPDGHSAIEDDVFLGPGVLTTNDSTMARHDADHPVVGATLRRACRVGGAVVITPGIEIGEEAFVAAGAVVTKDVPPRGVVMGVPGRVVRR